MAVGAFPWDDVGAWPAVERHFEPDAEGNTGLDDVVTLDASNNIVYSGDRLTALIGVDDLIVVQAEGVTMICPKDRAQDVKKMVLQLRDSGSHQDLL